jgi:hypothetical protein
MKAVFIIAGITLLAYYAVLFIYSLMSFIYDLFTKDESERYDEWVREQEQEERDNTVNKLKEDIKDANNS